MSDDKVTPTPTKSPKWYKSVISGGFGGMCLVGAGHPLDTIKVRLQTMTVLPGQAPPFKGALDCASKTISKEGFFALYRGMAAPIVGVTPMYSICFLGYDIGQRLQRKYDGEKLNLTQIFYAGCLSGVFTTAIMVPGERIKCILQIQGSTPGGVKYAGPIDCAKGIYRTSGIAGLYKGTVATLLRDIPGSGAYFAAYEGFKRYLAPTPQDLTPSAVLFAGGMAGVCNWLVSLPPDVLKSRFQTAPEGTYKGLGDVLQQLLAKEGVLGLYRGIGPVLLRAFPANAACFAGFEAANKFLDYLIPE